MKKIAEKHAADMKKIAAEREVELLRKAKRLAEAQTHSESGTCMSGTCRPRCDSCTPRCDSRCIWASLNFICAASAVAWAWCDYVAHKRL